jgi:hypothetical protein
MLARFAAFAERFAHSPWLDLLLQAPVARMRRCVLAIIILQAARRLPQPQQRPLRPASAPRGFARARASGGDKRAAIGARLHKRPRGKPVAQIAALVALLANAEAAIACVARRIARPRPRAFAPIAPPALTLLSACAAPAPARADTS